MISISDVICITLSEGWFMYVLNIRIEEEWGEDVIHIILLRDGLCMCLNIRKEKGWGEERGRGGFV
jgi:hypothetical protein